MLPPRRKSEPATQLTGCSSASVVIRVLLLQYRSLNSRFIDTSRVCLNFERSSEAICVGYLYFWHGSEGLRFDSFMYTAGLGQSLPSLGLEQDNLPQKLWMSKLHQHFVEFCCLHNNWQHFYENTSKNKKWCMSWMHNCTARDSRHVKTIMFSFAVQYCHGQPRLPKKQEEISNLGQKSHLQIRWWNVRYLTPCCTK